MRSHRSLFRVLAIAALAFGLATAVAHADPITTTLFYTTFSPTTVDAVNFSFNGTSTVTLSGNHTVAATQGADGVIFDPNNGNLLVAGQSQNRVTEVTQGGTIVGTISPGSNGQAYHFALTPGGNTVWALPNGGSNQIDIFGLPFGTNGTSFTVTGPDTDIRGVAFIGSQAYYGTASDGSLSGDFGLLNFTGSGFTTTQLATGVPAHGLTFDPFSGDIIISSANCIQQRNAAGALVSQFCEPAGQGFQFDQTAVDGHGHLWAASNNGFLVFLDYDLTGLIGTNSFNSATFLATNLDDIAPLSGGGSNPVPEPASLALLGTGLAVVARAVRRRRA